MNCYHFITSKNQQENELVIQYSSTVQKLDTVIEHLYQFFEAGIVFSFIYEPCKVWGNIK